MHGARVLIVEDDFLLLMELESILKEAGAEVAGMCRTVDDALAATRQNGFSAAILDVRIGDHSIRPVAHCLAEHGTPFIFYTGQTAADPELQDWAGRPVLAKPASADSIITALAEILHGEA